MIVRYPVGNIGQSMAEGFISLPDQSQKSRRHSAKGLILEPIPVAARPGTWVCGRSLAGIEGSNPAGLGMSVCCVCSLLSGRGLCHGLITRPEESYRVWCVSQCDRQWGGPGPLWAFALLKKNFWNSKFLCVWKREVSQFCHSVTTPSSRHGGQTYRLLLTRSRLLREICVS